MPILRNRPDPGAAARPAARTSDTRCRAAQEVGERVRAELRMAPRSREAPHVGHRFDAVGLQDLQEFRKWMRRMADGPDLPVHAATPIALPGSLDSGMCSSLARTRTARCRTAPAPVRSSACRRDHAQPARQPVEVAAIHAPPPRGAADVARVPGQAARIHSRWKASVASRRLVPPTATAATVGGTAAAARRRRRRRIQPHVPRLDRHPARLPRRARHRAQRGAAEHVLQLAHVARPVVARAARAARPASGAGCARRARLLVLLEEAAGERQHVAAALAQRRHRQRVARASR